MEELSLLVEEVESDLSIFRDRIRACMGGDGVFYLALDLEDGQSSIYITMNKVQALMLSDIIKRLFESQKV